MLWCLTEISYLLGHDLKRASSVIVILVFPIWYGELLFSFKRKAPFELLVHQYAINLPCH